MNDRVEGDVPRIARRAEGTRTNYMRRSDWHAVFVWTRIIRDIVVEADSHVEIGRWTIAVVQEIVQNVLSIVISPFALSSPV